MKTKLLNLLVLFTIFYCKSYSQSGISVSPPYTDYCYSTPFNAITFSVSNYDPSHIYEWTYEEYSTFAMDGNIMYQSAGTGQSIILYPSQCTRVILNEYDATNNWITGADFPLATVYNATPIPIYYDNYNCPIITVPPAFWYAFATGRWSMWYKDGVATGIHDYVIFDPQVGNYQYKLKLACGDTIMSDVFAVTSSPPTPVVTAAGASTVCMGDTVTLSIQPGFTYLQWKKNGVNISGATGASYNAIESGNYSISGSTWVGQGYCSKESAPFTVTVQSGAFITSADTAACGGDSILLNCTSASSYEWRRNNSVIPGATTQSIYVNKTGTYKVITTGLVCNTGKTKHIGIYNYPIINTNITGTVNLCSGTGLTLTASGTNINTYQWYRNNASITGGNTASIYATKAGNYKCTVANLIGCSKTSAVVHFNASSTNTLPTQTIILQPPSTGIDANITSDFLGANTNYGNTPFIEISNWYKYFRTAERGLLKFDLSSIPQNTPIIKATLKLYIDSVASWNNASQYLIFKRITQPWAENTVTFHTQPATTDYQNLNVAQSAIANKTFISLNAIAFVNYWVNINDNNGLMILSNEYANYFGWLRIATSDNANAGQRPKLTVTYAYAKIDSSGATTLCTGDSVTLTTNTGAYTYQWYQNNIAIAGATLNTYTAKTAGSYFVTITNATGCSVSSAAKQINVVSKPPATITAQGPTTFCNGDSVILQGNTGTGLTYQWLKNNINITNATASAYTAKTAGNYKVRVTNAVGCSALSSAKTITVPCREGVLITANNFDLFPNPSHNDFTIIADDNVIDNLKVFDASGKIIEEHYDITTGSQIGNDWNKGVYTIEIFSNSSRIYKRVIKM